MTRLTLTLACWIFVVSIVLDLERRAKPVEDLSLCITQFISENARSKRLLRSLAHVHRRDVESARQS